MQDTATGSVRRYTLLAGSNDGVADRTAFPCGAGTPDPAPDPPPDPTPTPGPNPGPTPTPDHTATSVTLHDRFVADIEFTVDGVRRLARVVDVDLPGTASALFHFGNPTNAELLFKVLEGCVINGQWWVFAAAATDLGYTITVRDTRARVEKVWFAEPGGSPPLTDTYAFPCS